MNPLARLLALPEDEKAARGLLYTPREIAQQPATWRDTFTCFNERLDEIRSFLRSAGLSPDSPSRPAVFLLGAGTSDYVGRSLAALLRQSWQCDVTAVPSTDLLTHLDDFLMQGQRYLWISFSRSGESPEGVALIEKALESHPEIHHLIVCCNAHSRMLKIGARRKQVLGISLPDAANDRGLAMTGAFTNMVVFGQCLANIGSPELYPPILETLVNSGKDFLQISAECAAVMAADSFKKACFVGSGPLKSVAWESALKLLELTSGKMQTMSESALGLRHGPMAALDEHTLFVCFLSGNKTVQRYETDLLEEIGRKRLVTTRVVVCGKPDSELGIDAEHILTHDLSGTLTDNYRPPLDVIFGQLLGLFFSMRCNLQPDCPSPSGAITRVVQNVLIHS